MVNLNPFYYWKNHRFETCVVIAVVVLIIFVLFDRKKKQTGKKELHNPIGWDPVILDKIRLETTGSLSLEDIEEKLKLNRGPSATGKGPGNNRFGKMENKCRDILEDYFKLPFMKIRPDWLEWKNGKGNDLIAESKRGNNLEIDLFNEHLKLCVEYNGVQHYKLSKFFHGGNEQLLLDQQERDRFKRDKCLSMGYKFIEIPYTVKEKELSEYIVKELKKNGY